MLLKSDWGCYHNFFIQWQNRAVTITGAIGSCHYTNNVYWSPVVMIFITDIEHLAKRKSGTQGKCWYKKLIQDANPGLYHMVFSHKHVQNRSLWLVQLSWRHGEKDQQRVLWLTLRYHFPVLSVISQLFKSSGKSDSQHFKWKGFQKHPVLLKSRLLLCSDEVAQGLV